MKLTASRVSEGNKIFPTEIIIESEGLTVKIPGLFSGKSRHLDYLNIGEVSIETPMIGYSTITFFTAGTRVSAHGFTINEVKQIKEAIDRGKKSIVNTKQISNNNWQNEPEDLVAETKAEKIEYKLERQKKEDNAAKPWMNDYNFRSIQTINSILYPTIVDDIEKTIERIIKSAIEKIKEVLNEEGVNFKDVQIGNKDFLKPYTEEFAMIETCLEKAQEGIKKLKRKDETEHPKIRLIIEDLEDSLIELKNKWLPLLHAQREKRKKKNIRQMIIIVGLNIFFWGGLWLYNQQ